MIGKKMNRKAIFNYIKSTLKNDLPEAIRNKPYLFLTEADLKCFLYKLFDSEGFFTDKNLLSDKGGYKTSLLHAEFPNGLKKRNNHGFYDLVILDPKHIKEETWHGEKIRLNQKEVYIGIEIKRRCDPLRKKEEDKMKTVFERMENDCTAFSKKGRFFAQRGIVIFVNQASEEKSFIKKLKKKIINELKSQKRYKHVNFFYLEIPYDKGKVNHFWI